MRRQELGLWINKVANRLVILGFNNNNKNNNNNNNAYDNDEGKINDKERSEEFDDNERVLNVLLSLKECSELRKAIVLRSDEENSQVAARNLVDAEICNCNELKLVLLAEALRYALSKDLSITKKALGSRARLLAKMGKYDKALEDLEMLLELEPDAEAENEALLQHCKKRLEEQENNGIKDSKKIWPSLSLKEPMSQSLRVVSNNEFGNHVVATEFIEAGKTLFTEEPIVSFALRAEDVYHDDLCHNCCKVIEQSCFIACPKCVSAVFCSTKCYKKAANSYHKYECLLQDFLRSTGLARLTLLMLSFRLVCQQESSYYYGDPTKELSSGYKRILNELVTHTEVRDIEKDLNVKRAFALVLLICLQKSGYFGQCSNKEEQRFRESRVLKALLRCIEAFEFNAHMVESMLGNRVLASDSETRLWKDSKRLNLGEVVETSRMGGAIYHYLSFVNHSCDPNLMVINTEGHLAIGVAARDIEEGEQIFDTYGPVFHHMDKQERQEALKTSHWFHCECVACQNDYNDFDSLPRDYLRLSGDHFVSKRCDRKALQREVDLCRKRVQKSFNEDKLDRAKEQLMHWSKLLTQIIKPPHRDYVIVRRGLRNCFWLSSGNSVQAAEDEEVRRQRNAAWANCKRFK